MHADTPYKGSAFDTNLHVGTDFDIPFVGPALDEVLGFEPTGSGEHLYLKIRKQDLGTTQVASLLAERVKTKHAGTLGIIMTGRCQAEISGRLGDVGLVNGLLFKPFNLDTMRERAVLSKSRPDRKNQARE